MVSALPATHKKLWTPKNELNYDNQNYYTKGYHSNPRQTKYLGGWTIVEDEDTKRVFCVEPGVQFPSDDTVEGYTSTVDPADVPKSSGATWDVAGDVEELKKVLSCWSNNNYSIISTQAIVWELISEERYKIEHKKILKGDYKPYYHVKDEEYDVYGDVVKDEDGNLIPTLYKLIKGKGDDFFNEYKKVLRCAARFNLTPSFSFKTASEAKASPKLLSSYDDSTQTFSKTFKLNSDELKLLKYYTVSSGDSAVKITKNDTSIKVTTNKELTDKSDAVKITLKYTYKDNGTDKLNDHGNLTFYIKNEHQALARGSRTKESYIYVYTGAKPTYQLAVQKKDEEGNPMSGIKFNVYKVMQP